MISVEQYNHLLSLLNNQQPSTPLSSSITAHEADPETSHAKMAGKQCFISYLNTHWLLDSGASDHICNNISWFQSDSPVSGPQHTITIPDGRQVSIQNIGSITLN